MNRLAILLTLAAIMLLCHSTSADWTRFRGPNGSGVSNDPAPVEFGADSKMKWKRKLPGPGVSSPIIVGDKIFVTCFSGYGGDLGDDIAQLKRHLVCVERKTGMIVWDRAVKADLPEDPWSGAGVPSHGYASHTPTSDGNHVFVFFGKTGVLAFDMDGNQKWKVNVGKESSDREWGSSSSPILHEDSVIVTASDESEALIALDKSTGQEKWRQEAEMLDSIWGTPAIAKAPNGPEVVLAVPGEIWGFNAETGKLRWYSPGNEGASHSVVISDDVAYSVGGGRGGSNGIAVKVGGSKEVTDLVWENNASGRFATPIVYEGRLYTVSGGIAACYDAKTGDKIFEERLPRTGGGDRRPDAGSSTQGDSAQRGGGRGGRRGRRRGFGGMEYASPIIAGDKIYVTTTSGKIHVLEASDEFKVVATNDLSFDKSGFNATPAASDGDLVLRSNTHLYCVGE